MMDMAMAYGFVASVAAGHGLPNTKVDEAGQGTARHAACNERMTKSA
jgi:hypothetical protein